jgi:PAS domain S-box-containing protein
MALQRSHLRFQAFLGAIAAGIEEVDLAGRIVFCNSTFSQSLGYEPAEIIGKLQSDLMPAPWIDAAKAQSSGGARRNHRTRRITALYKTRAGDSVSATVDWNAIRDENGDISGYVGIVNV